jgi:hypothetical protein
MGRADEAHREVPRAAIEGLIRRSWHDCRWGRRRNERMRRLSSRRWAMKHDCESSPASAKRDRCRSCGSRVGRKSRARRSRSICMHSRRPGSRGDRGPAVNPSGSCERIVSPMCSDISIKSRAIGMRRWDGCGLLWKMMRDDSKIAYEARNPYLTSPVKERARDWRVGDGIRKGPDAFGGRPFLQRCEIRLRGLLGFDCEALFGD